MKNISPTAGIWVIAFTGFISLTVMGIRNNKPELFAPSAASALSAAIALAVPKQDG